MLAMVPHADAIYSELWPGCQIERYSDKERGVHVLDRHFGIDVHIRLPNGLPLTIQEKFRKPEQAKFKDFTLEYYNDGDRAEEEGEWFHLCSDLYFYGYAADHWDGWQRWTLFKVADFKLAVAAGLVRLDGPIPNRISRANFYACPWQRFKPPWIVAAHDEEWRQESF